MIRCLWQLLLLAGSWAGLVAAPLAAAELRAGRG